MSAWRILIWIAGLVTAAAISWLTWRHFTTLEQDRRFIVSLLPLVLWAIVSVVLMRVFAPRSAQPENPSLRIQRRAVFSFLAERGLKTARARNSLPFYLVAGLPGSGKTSMLEHSDMRLGSPMAIGNTVWRAGSDAVFIEAAMGVPNSDLDDVIALLRSVRPKLPVNATLFVLSPADLTLADRFEQRSIAEAISNDLKKLDEATQMSVPVYFMLSRVDLVPGFKEFFDRQEPQERSQPWGFSLSLNNDAQKTPAEIWKQEIDRGFTDILAAMRLRHIELLSREGDPVRCGHIHGFAAQIAAIQRAIAPILDAMMPENNRDWKGALLRGIFLTSAKQETLSLDALLPEMSRRFAMPRSGMLPPDLGMDEEEQGYFIGGALQRAVLPEAGLVLRTRKRSPALALQLGAIALMVLTGAAMGYVLFSNFNNEIKIIARASEALNELKAPANPATHKDLPAVIAELVHLDEIEAEITTPELSSDLGLRLSNRTTLASDVQSARRQLRVNALVPQLAAMLEAELVRTDADVATLKDSLELVAGAASPDFPPLKAWLQDQSRKILPDNAETFVNESLAAIRQSSGLHVGQPYIDAARRLIAYKESLT